MLDSGLVSLWTMLWLGLDVGRQAVRHRSTVVYQAMEIVAAVPSITLCVSRPPMSVLIGSVASSIKATV